MVRVNAKEPFKDHEKRLLESMGWDLKSKSHVERHSDCMGFWPNSKEADFKHFALFLVILLIPFTQWKIRSLPREVPTEAT